MQTFRVFVSSPGDVAVERRRVESVVSRLNGEFAGVARLDAIRWETEAYQAHSTFQAQIPRSTECDLVIGILKWRLGTELPPDFDERLPSGQPFPSGTAYELLTAIEKRQKGEEVPDVYVFRFAGSSPSVPVEDPNRATIERDWQALKGFFQEWFLTERGQFNAAFNPYASEDDFEAQLEKLLRKWMADKVAGGRVVRWPIAVKGSPFCGLAAFGAKHAPVFFGRSLDIARAVDLWREAGNRGSPYLLVVGASGAGKSSLARAGLLPRLTTPGVVSEVDVWRLAVMRPGDSPAGPVAALAEALMQDEAGLAKEEESRGPALPEIAQGDSRTPAELAAVLRHAEAAAAVKPVVNALLRIGAAERERERHGRSVRCGLVLLLDQFEELFAASVTPVERTTFIALMVALVRTGSVWVVTTLRADFYQPMLEEQLLKDLKEAGASYDVAPPGAVELAEIVRAPAQAAGLVFEHDPAAGESLDARILRDAERPDMLPLVQLVLSRLFDARKSDGGEAVLPFAAYTALGGLKGIVDEAGEKALAPLGDAERARLPRLLRQLAVARDREGSDRPALTIRAVPLVQVAADAAARRLVDALVTARLLTMSGADADAQVRLTHQRVLDDWGRAHALVAESGEFYRIRAEVEDARRRWEHGGGRRELLLARGLPLAEGESIAARYGEELEPETLAYVRASRRRASRLQMLVRCAAVMFALLAVAASGAAWLARQNELRASRNLALAIDQSDALVAKIGDELQNSVGVSRDAIRQILQLVEHEFDQVARVDPGNGRLALSRAAMLSIVADNYVELGEFTTAADRARQCVAVARPLAEATPADVAALAGLARCLQSLGYAATSGGRFDEAKPAHEENVAMRRRLLAAHGDDPALLDALARALNLQGNLLLRTSAFAQLQKNADESIGIATRLVALDARNLDYEREYVDGRNQLYIAFYWLGRRDEAAAGFVDLLAVARKLAAGSESNAVWQRYLANIVGNAGFVLFSVGRRGDAIAALGEQLALDRRLVSLDPSNATWRAQFMGALATIAEAIAGEAATPSAQDLQVALAYYREAAAQARILIAREPGMVTWQFGLIQDLFRTAQMQMKARDADGARVTAREALAEIAKIDRSKLDKNQAAIITAIAAALPQ